MIPCMSSGQWTGLGPPPAAGGTACHSSRGHLPVSTDRGQNAKTRSGFVRHLPGSLLGDLWGTVAAVYCLLV